MAKFDVLDINGKVVDSVELSDAEVGKIVAFLESLTGEYKGRYCPHVWG